VAGKALDPRSQAEIARLRGDSPTSQLANQERPKGTANDKADQKKKLKAAAKQRPASPQPALEQWAVKPFSCCRVYFISDSTHRIITGA
jgi:hypothetical protein